MAAHRSNIRLEYKFFYLFLSVPVIPLEKFKNKKHILFFTLGGP